MPKVNQKKKPIDVFKDHGVLFSTEGHESEGECPFCDRENKFIVKDTGQYHCVVCEEGGNHIGFVKRLWELSLQLTKKSDYEGIAEDRGPFIPAFKKWGLAKSIISGEWIMPGFNGDGKMSQLYRRSGKTQFPTSTLGQGILNAHNIDPKRNTLYVLEGFWDGCAWQQAIGLNENVIALPGANVFKDNWIKIFSGKDVVLLFDSDYQGTSRRTGQPTDCLLYTSPSPRDLSTSRMPSSA